MTAQERAAQVGRKSENRTGGGGPQNIVEGMYDQFRINEKRSTWVRWSDVTYVYEIYDREASEVVEVEADFLEVIEHYYQPVNMRHWCSSGAHKDKPCFSCSHRSMHYDWVEKQEAKTPGTRLPDNRRRAPISASSRVILPLTICEKLVRVPVMTKEGSPRLSSRTGNPIFNWTPAPIAKLVKDVEINWEEQKDGMNVWWNLPQTVLPAYIDLKMSARHYCKNCPAGTTATPLVYKKYKCGECSEKFMYDEPMTGISTEDPELLEAPFRCPSCKHKGPKIPIPSCPTCGKGRCGTHLDFDYRLKKKELGDRMWTFEVTGMRVREDNPRYAELAAKPLDIKTICGPTPLARQEKLMPEQMRAQAGSRRHIKEKEDSTESYTNDSSDNMYSDE